MIGAARQSPAPAKAQQGTSVLSATDQQAYETQSAQISTQGEFNSPRGCRGTFGSSGTAEATRIDADFTGVECSARFTGRVVLTKQ